MAYRRSSLRAFSLANKAYANASVAFYTTDDDGKRTDTLATLYQAPTGNETLANPQRLDSSGKFRHSVYIDTPVIGVIGGDNIGSQQTATVFPSLSREDVQKAETAANAAADSENLAREWATRTNDDVGNTGLYSAREHATGDLEESGGSARAWAVDGQSPDGSGLPSAKTSADSAEQDATSAAQDATSAAQDATSAAQDATAAAQSATSAGQSADSAEDSEITAVRWATETGATVVDEETGQDTGQYSAKEHATGDLEASGGSAKAWAMDASSPDGTGKQSAKTEADRAEYWANQVENVPRTIYMSATGQDSNDGAKIESAVASFERARDIAAGMGENVAVVAYPGVYPCDGHVDWPDNVKGVVAATNSRNTIVKPTAGNEVKNVFRFGNGGYCEAFSFEGWQLDSLTDPTEGFAISFRPGAFIARTVFAFNIAVYRGSPPGAIPPPTDRENGNPLVDNGPGVAIADRAVASPYSPFPQIMLWGATPVSPNGVGYVAKNGGFINGINAVALWMHKHYVALNGGKVILTNCASQFGDYSLWSEGFRNEVLPDNTSAALVADSTAADTVEANRQTIVDTMWTNLVNAGYSVDETATRRDAKIYLTAIEYDLRTAEQESSQLFAKGLFDWNANFVANVNDKDAFVFSFEDMRDQIKAYAGVNTAAGTAVDGLTQLIVDTVNNPATRKVPSEVTSVGHQWNGTMAGVNARALNRPALRVPDSVIEKNEGSVTYSGVDDSGRQYFTGGAIVDPRSGKLEGPPIDRTILPRARRAALIAGGQR